MALPRQDTHDLTAMWLDQLYGHAERGWLSLFDVPAPEHVREAWTRADMEGTR